MNSINIYASKRKLTPRSKKLMVSHGLTLFIRTQVLKDMDCEKAMLHAKRMDGECFLNSVDELSFEH